MKIAASELILNEDGSIYHLQLKPENIANTIITVGDPDRVDTITKYFDSIRFSTHKREFKTTTGTYKGKELTVISTGIGTDNIDIVLNELDALVNIDLETRTVKSTQTSLDIIRIGTSGSIQSDIPIDSFLISKYAIGLDALVHFYNSAHIQNEEIQQSFVQHMSWAPEKSTPYVVSCDASLAATFSAPQVHHGFTATNIGFYAPQGRRLRLDTSDASMNDKLASFRFRESEKDLRITNLEMETSGIYGLAKLLGHRAVSLNAILANRASGTFSASPRKLTENLIQFALDCLVK
ncbi:nucleoside phosphorylase [Dokdonia sp. Hel_I_53]|uniref:nucleoside phosphorylase n=1 Tax=Dokdonia sp. Hel_I_53 TaxID=1566287 RepID=UPI0011992B2D|nr:nucleoside phosphorylase [Dokdonia sp. Hel_I_53]TVZ51705.1 uridine phosphorylase [Dokdonia sp. Hel_I_53]